MPEETIGAYEVLNIVAGIEGGQTTNDENLRDLPKVIKWAKEYMLQLEKEKIEELGGNILP